MEKRKKRALRSRQERIANEILMHFRNKKKSAQDVYISDPIDTDKDGNSLSLMDIMAADGNIFDDIELKMRAEQLHRFIDDLPSDRERQILSLRYGLGGNIPLTQREVADKLGISRSYVSRIEKKAISTLKRMFDQSPGWGGGEN